jgi:glycerophosphoryl diester phosphodiesterase
VTGALAGENSHMTNHDTALPKLIAHRGNAAEFPENTLQAFESAIELGVRDIEFDVQMTSDKVPVVFHDADLQRVADRAGSIHEMTWAELAETPVGEIKRFGRRFAFTYPPSLAQAVDALAGWQDVTAFVEIKRASVRRFGREVVLKRLADVLRPVLDKCVVISFDLPSVKIMRMMTGARIGWVLERYDEASLGEAAAAAPEFLFCNYERVPADAAQLWPGPWHWAIYEIRDLATAQRCHALGAAYVESMTVRAMQAAFAESRRKW